MHWLRNLDLRTIHEETKKAQLTDHYRLILAIIMVESTGQAMSAKYEHHYDRYTVNVSTYAKLNGISFATEENHQKTSWGLMQMMGGKAREYGYKGPLQELCLPQVGLPVMFRLFKDLRDRYGTPEKIAAAWNGGSVQYESSGVFRNERYVDNVMRFYREIESLKI